MVVHRFRGLWEPRGDRDGGCSRRKNKCFSYGECIFTVSGAYELGNEKSRAKAREEGSEVLQIG